MAAVNAIAISTAFKVLSASSSSSIRGELESVRSCFFWLLIVCTAIVAIGVLLEVAEDWFPLGQPVLDMNTGIFRPSPSIRWRKMAINLGWKLVMLGVIGEGIFEVATSGADEMLQQFNNTLLTITTEQAGSAAKSAKTAREEADAAKVESAAAREEAGDAIVKARAAERSLAKAEADAGKAQTAATNALTTATDAAARAGKAEASLGKAEAEAKGAEISALNALALAREARQEAASFESDLIRLKKQAEDRELDEYQQDEVRVRILFFPGTPYELAVNDTPEAQHLLLEIDKALSSAGWIYRGSGDHTTFRTVFNLPNGRQAEISHDRAVVIGFTNALLRFRPAVDNLVKALNAEGIATFAKQLPDSDTSPNNIHITVGAKP